MNSQNLIQKISISTYKSLRNVTFEPGPLSVLIGPNASGKSNFCDAIDFLSTNYKWNLETAVHSKGGYENICYRLKRRSKAPIEFTITAKLPFHKYFSHFLHSQGAKGGVLYFEHTFSFKPVTQAIKSPFSIVQENLRLKLPYKGSNNNLREVLWITRRDDKVSTKPEYDEVKQQKHSQDRYFNFITDSIVDINMQKLKMPETKSVLSLSHLPLIIQSNVLGDIRVHQFSPIICREAGVPTPTPEMDIYGRNLPGIIEYLKKEHPNIYRKIEVSIKEVMPQFEKLDVQYTLQKTLGLRLKESGFGRSWVAEDISDGTIQTIALLAAIYDPRTPLVVIEEPENSIHPWALRSFVEACRDASKTKQIILTTHSPIITDMLYPHEVWIVSRPESETNIDHLPTLDADIEKHWKEGKITLWDYLDSGSVRKAVP